MESYDAVRDMCRRASWLSLLPILAALFGAVSSQAAPTIGGSGIEQLWGNQAEQNGVLGGRFNGNGPRGVAVNNATGNVFVADTGNNRIQQFDEDGRFLRAWGQDVIVNTGTPPNSNGTGFEICDATTTPANAPADCKAGITTGETGGAFASPQGLALNQSNGHLYVTDVNKNRVQEFKFNAVSGRPEFVRAFGQDVVASGPEDKPAANAVQSLDIAGSVTDGTYTLSFRGETTVPLAYNAPASGGSNPEDSVQNALRDLDTVGATGVNVSGTGPYSIAFVGSLASAPMPMTTVDSTSLVGGTASVMTTTPGATGFEVCEDSTKCKSGTTTIAAGGSFQTMGYLAVVPSGGTAANVGNVLVANKGRNRIDEFKGNGEFVRAWGFDVVSSPPNAVTGFEVCAASAFDVCKAGQAGTASGQFATNIVQGIAADKNGTVLTVEPTETRRVQKFTLSLGGVVANGAFACPGVLCSTSQVAPSADNPTEVAVDASGSVYVVRTFPQGTGNPLVVVPAVQDSPAGAVQQRVLKLNSVSGAVEDTYLANPGTYAFGVDTVPRAIQERGNSLQGLAVTGDGLHLFIVGKNDPSTGAVASRARVYRFGSPAALAGDISVNAVATEVGASGATVEATIKPLRVPLLSTAYRIEYREEGQTSWFRMPTVDVAIGNGADGGESSECANSFGGRAASCRVSVELGGLESSAAYEYRVTLATDLNGLVYSTEPDIFETSAGAPPTVATGTAVWSGPPDSNPRLVFNGQLNPQGLATHFHFQYVPAEQFAESGWAAAEQVPIYSRDVGHGSTRVDVTAVADGVDAGRTYVYRLVASNDEGEGLGQPRTVSASRAGGRFIELISEGDNQGAGLREGPAQVSDDGQRVGFNALAFGDAGCNPALQNPFVATRTGDGWRPAPMCLLGGGGTADGSAAADSSLKRTLWVSRKSLGAWQWELRDIDGQTTPIGPLLKPIQHVGTMTGYRYLGASPDFSTFVFVNSEVEQGAAKSLFVDEPLVDVGGQGLYSNLYAIAGSDTPSPSLQIVNRASGAAGAVIGGNCGATLGAARTSQDGTATSVPRTGAVSEDGSVVYFSARPSVAADGFCAQVSGETASVRLFKRNLSAQTTTAVSASECVRTVTDPGGACFTPAIPSQDNDFFWGASSDGSKVFFTSPRQLVGSATDRGDTDTTDDLYLFDSSPLSGHQLTQVSAGEINADHPVVGSGAEVLGVTAVSMDGSRVYFVAKGRLTSEATQGANNLYVYQRDVGHSAGRIAFVATLSARETGQLNDPADTRLWSRAATGVGRRAAYAIPFRQNGAAGGGRFLVFASEGRLLPQDTDLTQDLYRYDDEAPTGQRLRCLSCVGNANADIGFQTQIPAQAAEANWVQRSRVASEDGSAVVFATSERLLAGDTNTAQDAYLWQDGADVAQCNSLGADSYVPAVRGCLSLVSAATGARGVVSGGSGVRSPLITADGRTVIFQTRATLLPQDRNNGGFDFYAARIDGGFPQLVDDDERDRCKVLGEDCLDPPPPLPPVSPSCSENCASLGNVVRKPLKHCPKGKRRVVKANGKSHCVVKKKRKKSATKKGKKKNRPSQDRRANR